jgi:hypothetical protein
MPSSVSLELFDRNYILKDIILKLVEYDKLNHTALLPLWIEFEKTWAQS